MLGLIHEGLVYGLDDDNAMHPNFPRAFRYCAHRFDGFCMPQEMRTLSLFQKVARRIIPNASVRPTVNRVRRLKRVPRMGEIDLAQYVLNRKLFGDVDWTGWYWDGEIIQEAYARHPGRIWKAPEPSCYYNYLRDFPRPWWWERQ